MSINRVNISGNLTRDSELRATQGGTQILNFGVAVNDRRRNQQGEWEDYPNYIDCVMFGSRATALNRYLVKGTKVAIEGKLRYSSWETREGQRRSKLEVVVDEIEFMSSRSAQGMQDSGGYTASAPTYATPAPVVAPAPQPQQAPSPVSAPPAGEVYDEDIPF